MLLKLGYRLSILNERNNNSRRNVRNPHLNKLNLS